MSCPTFEAFALAAEVGDGLDRVVEAVMAALLPLKTRFADSEHNRAQWVPQTYTAHLKLASLNPARRDVAHLAIHFDLARPGAPGEDWPWERTSLVVIAYALSYDAGWQGEHLAVLADGRIAYEDQASLRRFAEDRLLASEAPASGSWADAEWAYAVPFAALDEAEGVRKQIAQPVSALLLLGEGPEKALAGADAVTWAAF